MGKSIVASALWTAVTATIIMGLPPSTWADGKWQKTHPRREQVNQRLDHQNRRINQEYKEGELTKQQANKLHRDDRQIRQEERNMANQNGGHLTKSEQRVLNQQENAVSRQIGQ